MEVMEAREELDSAESEADVAKIREDNDGALIAISKVFSS